MEQLITVYIENIKTGGQNCFEFFECKNEADKHFQKVRNDIIKFKKESKFKAVKRLVDYDKHSNSVSF